MIGLSFFLGTLKNFKSPETSLLGNLKLFSVARKMIFTSISRHQCDHMTDFDFFGKIFMISVFPVNFSQKYCLSRNGSIFFHFSYVFLNFEGITFMCLNKN